MLDIRELDLDPEINVPSTSFSNISKLKQVHGDIVGICHCKNTKTETTQIVFFDGYIHDSNGFIIKQTKSEVDQMKLLGFMLVLYMVPGLGPSCQAMIEECLEKEITKTTYFIFKIGNGFLPENNIYSYCSGSKTFNELLSFIAMEENIEMIEIYP